MSAITPARAAGASLAAIFGALAIASPALIEDEGWVTVTYDDPVHGAALPTACGGITGAKYGITPGRKFTQAECAARQAGGRHRPSSSGRGDGRPPG